MKIAVAKTEYGAFVPVDDESVEAARKITPGEIHVVKIKPYRNYSDHKRFFALLNFVFQNQDIYDNKEDLLVEIKLKSGWYEEHITTKGVIIYKPKSISFDDMPQDEFMEFYNKAIDVIFKYFIRADNETERQRIMMEVSRFA